MKICMDCLYAWDPTHCFNPLPGYHKCESCQRVYMQCMASVLEPGEEPDTKELESAIVDVAKSHAMLAKHVEGTESVPYLRPIEDEDE